MTAEVAPRGKRFMTPRLATCKDFGALIGKTKLEAATMDTDRNGAPEAFIAACAFSFLFLSVLGLMMVSEAKTRPGNPHIFTAALSAD